LLCQPWRSIPLWQACWLPALRGTFSENHSIWPGRGRTICEDWSTAQYPWPIHQYRPSLWSCREARRDPRGHDSHPPVKEHHKSVSGQSSSYKRPLDTIRIHMEDGSNSASPAIINRKGRCRSDNIYVRQATAFCCKNRLRGSRRLSHKAESLLLGRSVLLVRLLCGVMV